MDARVGETVVMIAAGNVESERLAMRLGYRQFRVMTLDGVVMGLSRRRVSAPLEGTLLRVN
jgi:hypothetical protein